MTSAFVPLVRYEQESCYAQQQVVACCEQLKQWGHSFLLKATEISKGCLSLQQMN